MAKTVKHVGKIRNTGVKVAVAFRTVPGESDRALVINVAQLPDAYHDTLMQVIESDQAQDAFELGELLFIRNFPDGRPMLRALQVDGRLEKVATDAVMMMPTPTTEIPLDQLNLLIAEQKNCTVDDLCTFVSGGKKEEPTQSKPTATPEAAKVDQPLSDKDLAKSFRSQADALYKEAALLRKQADEIDPPQKKVSKAKETSDA